jgi:hypothetical protein
MASSLTFLFLARARHFPSFVAEVVADTRSRRLGWERAQMYICICFEDKPNPTKLDRQRSICLGSGSRLPTIAHIYMF